MDIIPENETKRIAAVRRYEILDTPPDGAFDSITAIAARRFGVFIAIVSIVDTDRIWFKSHHGLPAQQSDREAGVCESAILTADPHIQEEVTNDPCALANPLVADDLGCSFYAGVPHHTRQGVGEGNRCVYIS